ncbi:YkgJ family cysteine cluster protein [Anoxybacteroides tepidamans]|uniref:YkgJ family cysteine cluster protein n=1 Tax=Anoxybacteroides tepidamans TaxID=265948 RepID=UPI000483E85A|nr:YkgJ family cysteine cluster protein [Anoxybacillus tepidamans]
MKKHLTYEEMIKICQTINRCYLPSNEAFEDAIDDLFEKYEEDDAKRFLLQAFKKLLALVDQEIQIIEQKVAIRPTCEKGCAYCCYFPIIITKMEAKLMMAYIDSLPAAEKEDIHIHLVKYFQKNKEKLQKLCAIDFTEAPDFKEQYIVERLPCPFLDLKTNTCKVYEVRPIPCRTYLNYCSPKACADSYIPKEPFSYEFFYEYYMEALNEIVQELLYENEDIGIDYPEDAFVFDYLPNFLKSIKNI